MAYAVGFLVNILKYPENNKYMYYSNVKSEQITKSGIVINDKAEILTDKELQSIILKYFDGTQVCDKKIYGTYRNKKYCIYYKNISYLGNPWPLHKKRIQIAKSFSELYEENSKKGITTLIIGVYSYKENIILVDFQIKQRGKNSSAHVYSNDLRHATINGYFKKNDNMGNVIIAFNPTKRKIIEAYLEEKLYNENLMDLPFISYFDNFFDDIDKNLNGIRCYKEMSNDNYNNARQSEWAGFYIEYKLEQYLNKFDVSTLIQFLHNKSKGQIDLDLYFPQNQCYGDLKTHSNDSKGILGNDLQTIKKLINKSSIYYIVCNHDTEKDKDYNYEVTIFWNKLCNKDNLYSYGEKMKHSIKITDYQILEINKFNGRYLGIFNQGINSNQKSRTPKIQIKERDINNFLIHKRKYA